MSEPGFDSIGLYRGPFATLTASVTPASAELTAETDKNRVRAGDGATLGSQRFGLLPLAGQTVITTATPLVGGAWTTVAGLTVTLPEVGRWVIRALIGYSLVLTDPPPRAQDAEAYARFVNVTQGLLYAEQALVHYSSDNVYATDVDNFEHSSMFGVVDSVAGADVIGVEVFRTVTPTWAVSTAGLRSHIIFMQATTDT